MTFSDCLSLKILILIAKKKKERKYYLDTVQAAASLPAGVLQSPQCWSELVQAKARVSPAV